jgi:tRNA dimethylallyltransferase
VTDPVFVIAGPTASGKSSLAVAKAQKENGVVINADSVQIYAALPLLAAQPSPAEREAAPHRLYGVLAPQEKCSAMRWRDMALAEIAAARRAGKTPIVVGGTGLYLKALIEGLSPVPPVPEDVRAAAAARQKELGNPAFHAELAARDPAMGAQLHPNDTQRLIRARSVLEATGKSLAHWQSLAPEDEDGLTFHVTLVMPPRDVLSERCDRRFGLMMDAGALEEARGLHERIEAGEIAAGVPVTHALGFHELRAYLRGEISLEDAVARAKIVTRQYAKRQATWFRGQMKPHPRIADIVQIS